MSLELNHIQEVLPYALGTSVVLVALYMAARWLVGKRFEPTQLEARALAKEAARYMEPGRRPPTSEEITALVAIQKQEEDDDIARCPCGEPATHPIPKLLRERASGDQSKFAGAPRYRRIVPEGPSWWDLILHLGTMGKYPLPGEPVPEVCEAHAHVADADMDMFIYVDIRAAQAQCNQGVAQRAADFETERLMQRIRDGLTEEQKKKVRQLSSGRKRIQLAGSAPNVSDRPGEDTGT